MKKVIPWILLLSLLICCLSGCGSDEEALSATEPGNESPVYAPAESIEESKEDVTDESISPQPSAYRVAMITDYMDIDDMGYNQTTYEAGRDWCAENNIPYTYYKPDGDSTEARVASVEQAIREGANVLLLPGYSFAGAIVETAEKYPEVYYIALDVGEIDLQDAAGCVDDFSYVCPKNVFSAVYQEEIAGFLAGYATVKMEIWGSLVLCLSLLLCDMVTALSREQTTPPENWGSKLR